MTRKTRMALALVLAGFAAPALAEEPYYFHKAAVDREAYMADVERCASLSTGVKRQNLVAQPLNPSAPYAVESAAIASFFLGFLESRERRRLVSRIERTCMADKGYKRRVIEKPAYQKIRKLDDKARLDRLFALVSAPEPIGKVLVE